MNAKRMTLGFLVLSVLFLAILSGCSKSESAAGQKYHCPMHPTYVSDRPGDCPICNMKLVPIKEDKPAPKAMAPATDEGTAHIKPGQWYCPMHTEIVSNAPGTCPECNMKLIQKQEAPAQGHEGHEIAAESASVPGRVSISVSPEKRQLIGLTLAKVEQRDLSRTVRTAALVEHDETKYAVIAPRFSGWVRKLYVNYTGAPVEKGEPLFSVYSPQLFATENEYLVAWRAAQQLKDGATPAQKDSAGSLLESARLRLGLFQISDEEIRELEKRGKASLELLLRAPFSGHVIVKNAVEGAAFEQGKPLFEIGDLSRVWLRAYVFEYELPLISPGQDAVVNFPYLGNKSFNGKVTFIYPHIEPQTRRGQIRVELDNPGHLIRPEMWANVEIRIDTGKRLTVPASAIIDTGQRYVAFVQAADHHLEPRQVKIGIKSEDYYEVLSGLKDGEQVVSRALFLLDSESQLKAAIAGMGAAGAHQH